MEDNPNNKCRFGHDNLWDKRFLPSELRYFVYSVCVCQAYEFTLPVVQYRPCTEVEGADSLSAGICVYYTYS